MKYHLCTACLYVLPIVYSHAAALEQSHQSVSAFLQENNYAEITLLYLEPNVSGQVQYQQQLRELGVTDFSTGDLVESKHFINAGLKLQLSPQLSFGLLFDQPFGGWVNYQYTPEIYAEKIEIESSHIQFDSRNMTALIGYQPTPRWNFFTGISWQDFKGYLEVFGQDYAVFNGYSVAFERDSALGWLTGFSYQIPEYAFKTAVTYRAKIKHRLNTYEHTQHTLLNLVPENQSVVETPQSVNAHLQTAISTHNLVYADLRWVNWSDFSIQPPQFNAVIAAYAPYVPEISGYQLISYPKDQWSAKIGWAHRWTPTWVSFIESSWDSGTGNTVSTLNPSDGFSSFGTGVVYRVNQKNEITFGAHYLKFRKAKINTNTDSAVSFASLATSNNNNALVYGLRLAHRF